MVQLFDESQFDPNMIHECVGIGKLILVCCRGPDAGPQGQPNQTTGVPAVLGIAGTGVALSACSVSTRYCPRHCL